MADRINENWIFCHECSSRWPRSEHGLKCPHCDSEFVEFITDGPGPSFPSRPPTPPPHPQQFQQREYNPYNFAQEPHEPFEDFLGGNITRHHFRSDDGRFTYASATFRPPNRQTPFSHRGSESMPATDPLAPLFTNLNAFFQGLAAAGNPTTQYPGNGQPGSTDGTQQPSPQDRFRREPTEVPPSTIEDVLRILQRDLLGREIRPRDANGRVGGPNIIAPNPLEIVAQIMGIGHHGDAVYSQEELDRVISDLIERTGGGNAPGPASAEAIQALPKKQVDNSMLGSDGKAECSICMESVVLTQEVTELPCKHWFHEACISAWLNEHDTCPHCRRGISDLQQSQEPPNSSASASSSSLPRRGSRPGSGSGPSSSFGFGFGSIGSGSGSRSNPFIVPDASPRPHSSSGNSGPGRITGWVRQHFGGGGSHNHGSGGNSNS